VMVAVTELARSAVGHTDLPKRPTEPQRLPLQFAERFFFRDADGDVRQRELAENTVGNGVQRVISGADVWDREASLRISLRPELIKLRVALPVHQRRKTSAKACEEIRRVEIGGRKTVRAEAAKRIRPAKSAATAAETSSKSRRRRRVIR